MNDLRKAAEMALDTLDAISESGIYYKERPFDAYMRLRSMARGAIEALRTALAQPEQANPIDTYERAYYEGKRAGIAESEAIKTQPAQEPMSFQTWRSRQHGDPEEIGFLQALKHAYESGQYSVSPPRKEWVGMTDEEIQDCEYFCGDIFLFAYEIESKLKEKNNG